MYLHRSFNGSRATFLKGFTMAEVLITLMILGVIAMVTIPGLIQKYKKHEVEVRLKSAYSILSKALLMAQVEYGSFQEMTDKCRPETTFHLKANCFANNYLKPYLKYTKSCDSGDVSCTRTNYSSDRVKLLDGTLPSGGIGFPSEYANFKLNNGIWTGVMWWGAPSPHFIVDINGSAGPNQSGTDVFYFTLQKGDNSTEPTSGLRCSDHAYEPTVYIKSIWCEKYPNDKQGASCSCPIMFNNWKIPDDYPVHF